MEIKFIQERKVGIMIKEKIYVCHTAHLSLISDNFLMQLCILNPQLYTPFPCFCWNNCKKKLCLPCLRKLLHI